MIKEAMDAMNRDELGQIVRQAWKEWAETQTQVALWRVPWTEMEESMREGDRLVGERVRLAVLQGICRVFKNKIIEVKEDNFSAVMRSSQFRELVDLVREEGYHDSYADLENNLAKYIKTLVNDTRLTKTKTSVDLKLFKTEMTDTLKSISDDLTFAKEDVDAIAKTKFDDVIKSIDELIFDIGVYNMVGDVSHLSRKVKLYLQEIYNLSEENESLKQEKRMKKYAANSDG